MSLKREDTWGMHVSRQQWEKLKQNSKLGQAGTKKKPATALEALGLE